MSKIGEYLNKIKTAIYGREVRDAIHDSIKECYTDVTNAKTLADDSVTNANAATENANTAADKANAATTKANTAANNANSKADLANTASATANSAAKTASDAAKNADAKALLAENAAADATSAAGNANTAADNANANALLASNAADGANEVANAVQNKLDSGLFNGKDGITPTFKVQAVTGEPGTDAEIEQSGTSGNILLKFTIPRGDTGNIGALNINGKSPDAGGKINLTANDVGALEQDALRSLTSDEIDDAIAKTVEA